jgi:hypothetical protein
MVPSVGQYRYLTNLNEEFPSGNLPAESGSVFVHDRYSFTIVLWTMNRKESATRTQIREISIIQNIIIHNTVLRARDTESLKQ